MLDSLLIHDSVYGTQEIMDPCALAIINTPQMQRLKEVNQYGVWNLFDSRYFSSRFDHCVGVYLLLRKLGASREEQLAGLIHDIGHTAFSHVIDYVFDDQQGQTIHEKFHHKILQDSPIPTILRRYGFTIERITSEHLFGILERDLPRLCADRVDYFLRDSLCIGVCSKEEITTFLDALTVFNNEIVLTDAMTAEHLARKFMNMTLVFWGSPVQAGSYQLMGNILKRALQKGVITTEDFFLTDNELLQKLRSSHDTEIIASLQLFTTKNILEGTSDDHTFFTLSKARYVNPLVLQNGIIKCVTILVPGFEQEIQQFQEKYKKGYFIKIVK